MDARRDGEHNKGLAIAPASADFQARGMALPHTAAWIAARTGMTLCYGLAMLKTLLLVSLLLATPGIAAEWRYTDGAGKSVVLDQPPIRIIAHSSVAAALIPYGIRPVGILRDGPPSLDRSLQGLDLEAIPTVSQGWFDIDAEAVLNLDPDIIITEYALAEHTYQGGIAEGAMAERLQSIAPTIGIARTSSIMGMLDAYRDFAQSLGADTQASALVADRVALEAAINALKSAAAARPDLTLMAISPGSSGPSIAIPSYFGELADFAGWGVHLVSPEVTPGTSYLTISWENAALYPADILLLDDRWETSPYEMIRANPIGQRLPAVIADQLGDWPAEWIRSPAVYAEQIDKLTALIARSHTLH